MSKRTRNAKTGVLFVERERKNKKKTERKQGQKQRQNTVFWQALNCSKQWTRAQSQLPYIMEMLYMLGT